MLSACLLSPLCIFAPTLAQSADRLFQKRKYRRFGSISISKQFEIVLGVKEKGQSLELECEGTIYTRVYIYKFEGIEIIHQLSTNFKPCSLLET